MRMRLVIAEVFRACHLPYRKKSHWSLHALEKMNRITAFLLLSGLLAATQVASVNGRYLLSCSDRASYNES